MRADALGFFWRDEPPPPKQKAEKIKATPPRPVWLEPDYLPGLEEAERFDVHVMSERELVQAQARQEKLLFDIESYSNYFIASFRSKATGWVRYYELHEERDSETWNIAELHWLLHNFCTVGFNSLNYDIPITTLALAGHGPALLKHATNLIITEGWRPSDVLRQYKLKKLAIDHIDLIEVAPLRANLKVYGGRLHCPRMQDLPFAPETVLSEDQKKIVRWYNINSDLTNTGFMLASLKAQIDLRYQLSEEHGVDVRSKSDAQIAEAVIEKQLKPFLGERIQKPQIDIGTAYRYQVPHYMRFRSPLMQWALGIIANSDFVVDETGSIGMPEAVKQLNLDINGSIYRMGIGGLHSSEKKQAHRADSQYMLVDKDVTSYYPFIILNQSLYPRHLGSAFLSVYKEIVDRRLRAKEQGDKATAESLKITINGSFGKLGSKYSILYSPDLLIQVTVTGQLSLLLLIERLELAGIRVVSANTDGVVIKCLRSMQPQMDAIIKQWEADTCFQTEGTEYTALYSRDVNNYIAVKPDGTVKTKGAYANPWANSKNPADRMHKNPQNTICIEAVEELLVKGTPVAHTVRGCRDITRFVSVRTVKGGAAKVWSEDNIEYLGKSIRWYYSSQVDGCIVYCTNGNKVPRSDNARPLLDLPDEFPDDIHYDWYINECESILEAIGYNL